MWSHKQLLGVVSHTPVEVEGLNAWMAQGWHDAVRHFVPAGAETLHVVVLPQPRLGGLRPRAPA